MEPSTAHARNVRVRLCWRHLLAQLWAAFLDMPSEDGLVAPEVRASRIVQERALTCPRCRKRAGLPSLTQGVGLTEVPVWNPSTAEGEAFTPRQSLLPPAGTSFGDNRSRPGRSVDIGWVIMGAVVLAVALAVASSGVYLMVKGETATTSGDPNTTLLDSLQAGDCLQNLSTGQGDTVPASAHVVPCTMAHTDEVVGTFSLPGDAYPGDRRVEAMVERGCDERFHRYVGLPVRQSSLGSFMFYPSQESWQGSHVVVCTASFGQQIYATTVKESGLRWADPAVLAVGDCAQDATPEANAFTSRQTSCSAPHDLEVFAKFDLPAQDYPGDAALKKLATTGCEARFRSYVGVPLRDSELESYPWWPAKEAWPTQRVVACLLVSPADVTGSLRNSGR